MSWRLNNHGEWNHAPWWKVAINTPLRAIQRGRRYNWLLCTVVEEPGLMSYEFAWIRMRDDG